MRVKRATAAELPNALLFAKKIFPSSRVSVLPGDAVFIVEGKGDILGLAHVQRIGNIFRLNGIGVEKGLRGRGIGSALLSSALAYCKREGAARVVLEVRESNIAAARVYAKHGFVAARRRGENVLMRVAEPN